MTFLHGCYAGVGGWGYRREAGGGRVEASPFSKYEVADLRYILSHPSANMKSENVGIYTGLKPLDYSPRIIIYRIYTPGTA